MSIKFVCSCGKRLRAREGMAGRRSMCPRCGNPVGIPSLEPTHPGAPAQPLTPAQRLARKHSSHLGPDDDFPTLAADAVVPSAPQQRDTGSRAPAVLEPDQTRVGDTRRDKRETPHGRPRPQLLALCSESLLYAVRAWLLIIGLAFALAVLTAGTMLFLPKLVQLLTERAWYLLALAPPGLLIPLVVAGYACGVLECALNSGIVGEDRHLRWPGLNLGMALQSGLTWLVCFLAGPVVLASLTLFYWIHGGDLVLLDWLILAELCVLCVSYWLFALLAISQCGRLRDLNPLSVADLIHHLGSFAVLVVFVAAMVAIVHGRLLLMALAEHRRDPGSGILSLTACWASGLGWGTFLLRLLGGYCRLTDEAGAKHGAVLWRRRKRK